MSGLGLDVYAIRYCTSRHVSFQLQKLLYDAALTNVIGMLLELCTYASSSAITADTYGAAALVPPNTLLQAVGSCN